MIWENDSYTEKCSVALSTGIASIGLCQPQSQSMPFAGVDLLRGRPLFTPLKENQDWRIKKIEQRKIRKGCAEYSRYRPIK